MCRATNFNPSLLSPFTIVGILIINSTTYLSNLQNKSLTWQCRDCAYVFISSNTVKKKEQEKSVPRYDGTGKKMDKVGECPPLGLLHIYRAHPNSGGLSPAGHDIRDTVRTSRTIILEALHSSCLFSSLTCSGTRANLAERNAIFFKADTFAMVVPIKVFIASIFS